MMRECPERGGTAGQSFPLGATVCPHGVNFSVFSKRCTAMELLFFDDVDDGRPSRVISLDPRTNRTSYYWHVFVPDVLPGQLYGFRAYGPYRPDKGLRFNGNKLLLDPYARGVAVGSNYSREAATGPGDNTAQAMKSVVADASTYDWEGDAPLQRPFAETVIYEMHVGGFTRHPSSGVAPDKRGTFLGLIDKIPYLKSLGVTAVEMLPVFQFDEQDAPGGLVNYWGYSPVSFFAPHCGYTSVKDPLAPLDEFRDMVKALHSAGIEVILDVVYNHSAEGNHTGPTLSFRGLENSAYYILTRDRSRYANYSGTGNTLNANHSIVRRMVLDSLRYWASEMHVDGFRFDLASVLYRDQSGHPLVDPPVLWEIESDPVLAGTKLIAEAWDAGGLYHVGNFIGERWKEWNGQFRDDVRNFVKGEPGMVAKLADRFFASPDIYAHEGRESEQSINFVTCHDGLTLNDLVSYNRKHNEANLEGNRDGNDHTLSWNCGVEGPTDDPEIERLRNRQIKNFFVINLLSFGTPMLLMGDEIRRTQQGNNNAYCQDNAISWFDWSLAERHGDIFRFVKRLIEYRLHLNVLEEHHNMTLAELWQKVRIQWHGVTLHQPDWGPDSHSLAFSVPSITGPSLFHVILNAYWKPLEFELPPVPEGSGGPWRRVIDTYLDPPDDICSREEAPDVITPNYLAQPRSVVVLMAAVQE